MIFTNERDVAQCALKKSGEKENQIFRALVDGAGPHTLARSPDIQASYGMSLA